MVCYNLLVQIW
jgi:hypothetical protein